VLGCGRCDGGEYSCSGSLGIWCLLPRALSISTLRTLTTRRKPSVRAQTASSTSLRQANGLKIRNHLIVEPSVRFPGKSMRRLPGTCKVPLLRLSTIQLNSLADSPSKTMRKNHLPIDVEAAQYDVDCLIEAVLKLCAK
jgi:hypothetical protein